MLLILVSLASVRAVGPYIGSGSNPDYTVHEVENLEYDPARFRCIDTLHHVCNSRELDIDECARNGILNWRKNPEGSNDEDYVNEYFELFRSNLVADSILLPDEFCYKESREYMSDQPQNRDTEVRRNRFNTSCKELLRSFKELELSDLSNPLRRQQSLQNIAIYAFYQTTVSDYPLDGCASKYMTHISEKIQVSAQMIRPINFCIDKFPVQ